MKLWRHAVCKIVSETERYKKSLAKNLRKASAERLSEVQWVHRECCNRTRILNIKALSRLFPLIFLAKSMLYLGARAASSKDVFLWRNKEGKIVVSSVGTYPRELDHYFLPPPLLLIFLLLHLLLELFFSSSFHQEWPSLTISFRGPYFQILEQN